MGQYTAKRRIDHGRVVEEKLQERRYEAGETIELDDAEARALLDTGAIEPADPKAKFQDAVARAEVAARELEAAGGDPGEAAHELKVRQREAMGADDHAIDTTERPEQQEPAAGQGETPAAAGDKKKRK